MSARRLTLSVVFLLTTLILLSAATTPVGAAEMKLEALLLWGTDDAKSPNPKHKPVEPEIKKRLKNLPLKWTNYFEENRVTFTVPEEGIKKVPLSDVCQIDVRNAGNNMIEVTHYGRGKEVAKQRQALPKGEMWVLAGNAPDSTAWLVVLKRLQ